MDTALDTVVRELRALPLDAIVLVDEFGFVVRSRDDGFALIDGPIYHGTAHAARKLARRFSRITHRDFEAVGRDEAVRRVERVRRLISTHLGGPCHA